MAAKPVNMTYEEAASISLGGLHAVHFLRKANIQRGQKVLVIGAGGSIGTVAVQVAKSLGAEITAVDSGGKLGMLRSIGADHVIDYSRDDFAKSGEAYDVIFDVVGKASFSTCMKSMRKNGFYLMGNPGLSHLLRKLLTSRGRRVIGGAAAYSPEDLAYLQEVIGAGKVRSVIDRRYPLERMADAHRYVDTGQKAGNVVITVYRDNRGG